MPVNINNILNNKTPIDSSNIQASSVTNWPLFFVGCIFLIFTFAFCIYGFSQPILNDVQRDLLMKWALPIASAIVSGTFAGSITVQGELKNGLKVGAVGGFAVWLVSLAFTLPYPGPGPGPSNTLRVTQFNFLDESSAELVGNKTTLARLERRSNKDYKVNNPTDLKIAFGLVINGFKVEDATLTKIQITTSMLDENGTVLASSDVESFDTLREWQYAPIARRLTPKNIINEFSVSEKAVAAGMTMPIIILLNNFNRMEIPNRKGFIRVRIHDALADRTITYEEKIGIIRIP